MQCHPNARLAPKGRAQVFMAVEAGMTVVTASQAFRVSRRWHYRWLLPRWRAERERGSGTGAAGLIALRGNWPWPTWPE